VTTRKFSRRVALTTTFLGLAAGGLAACDLASDDPNEDGHFYCSDSNGTVVDEDYCDDQGGSYDGGGFYYFSYMGSSVHGGTTYPVGSKLPAGHQKFKLNDTAARTKFGLPASGRVSNGTVKSGVIGKGGPGSSAKVGGSYGGGGKSSGG
jgi:hypothetical protein